MRRFFYNILNGFINLYKYFPVVWKDRQWDYFYFYELLRFKLNLMYKEFVKDDVYVGQGRDAKKIKICINLLDRIIKDEYHENVFMFHNRKWGKLDFQINDGKFQRMRENVITEEEDEQENKEFIKLMEHEEYLKNQDKRMLFQILNRYIENWWI